MKYAHWLVRSIFYKHTSLSLQKRVADASFLQAHQRDSLYYDVAFMDQQHMNLCQEASIAMICQFFKRPFNAMNYNPRGVSEGSTAFPRDFEEGIIYTMDTLKEILNTRGPFVLTLSMNYQFGHAVTCIGYIDNYLIYHDPLEGPSRCILFTELTAALGKSSFGVAWNTDSKNTNLATAKMRVTSTVPVKTFYMNDSYAYFFRLPEAGNQYDPCQAVIQFLEDYAKNETWYDPFRPHREKVLAFVHKIRSGNYQKEDKDGCLKPDTLIRLIDQDLGSLGGGTLAERMKVIKTFVPVQLTM